MGGGRWLGHLLVDDDGRDGAERRDGDVATADVRRRVEHLLQVQRHGSGNDKRALQVHNMSSLHRHIKSLVTSKLPFLAINRGPTI